MSKPALKEEGNFTMKVIAVSFLEYLYKTEDPNAFHIRIDCEDEKGSAVVYLACSSKYIDKGAGKGKTEADYAMDQLDVMGVPENGRELAKIDAIVGKTISVFGKIDTKGHLRFYLSSNRPEVKVDPAAIKARLARLMSGAGAPPKVERPPTSDPANPAPIEGNDDDIQFPV